VLYQFLMELNYIILAHKNPAQVKRLVEAISDDRVNIYLHVDKNADITPFKTELANYKRVIILPDELRVACVWGGLGIVRATANLIKAVVQDKRTGYVILMSGQDYPTNTKTYIRNFFEQHNGTNFIHGEKLPASFWPGGGMNKINLYTFFLSQKREDYISLSPLFSRTFFTKHNISSMLKFLRRNPSNIFKCRLLFKKRKYPSYIEPYGGSQWWALPMETVAMIDRFLDEHPGYYDFHKNTFAPDEIFFHSIVFSNIHKLQNNEVADTITYVDWSVPNSTSPRTFTAENLPALQQSHRIYARKFDTDVDAEIFDLVDEKILNTK
jgi:hypothetical protein